MGLMYFNPFARFTRSRPAFRFSLIRCGSAARASGCANASSPRRTCPAGCARTTCATSASSWLRCRRSCAPCRASWSPPQCRAGTRRPCGSLSTVSTCASDAASGRPTGRGATRALSCHGRVPLPQQSLYFRHHSSPLNESLTPAPHAVCVLHHLESLDPRSSAAQRTLDVLAHPRHQRITLVAVAEAHRSGGGPPRARLRAGRWSCASAAWLCVYYLYFYTRNVNSD